jgi:hypothetical protein
MKNRYLYLFKIGYLCSVLVHQADVLLRHAFEQRATINKLSKPALSTGLYQTPDPKKYYPYWLQ